MINYLIAKHDSYPFMIGISQSIIIKSIFLIFGFSLQDLNKFNASFPFDASNILNFNCAFVFINVSRIVILNYTSSTNNILMG